jgi:hypothetical protein
LDIIGEENACFGLFFASILIIANNWFKKNCIFRKEKIIVHSQNGGKRVAIGTHKSILN